VVKAYSSRVGEGAFPTQGESADSINRHKDKEDYLQDSALSEGEKKIVLAGDVDHPRYDLFVSRYLRETADEFGSTTGRPRRVGWIDAVALRKAAEINGFDSLILTRLDNLDGIGKIKICKAYHLPYTGEKIEVFPNDQETLHGFVPQYEILPGWKNTKGICSFRELPQAAKDYIATLESYIHGIKVSRIKNGCRQEDYIQGK
jgi:adenylosuccinate synthase